MTSRKLIFYPNYPLLPSLIDDKADNLDCNWDGYLDLDGDQNEDWDGDLDDDREDGD